MPNINILAIESSCDDTSAAVIQNGILLSNKVATQEMHKEHGGVVPELASRIHQLNITRVVDIALKDANVLKTDLTAIAFTKGPGLMGSLLVGISFAKGMAMGLNIPLIAVNHMQAHILAHFIEDPKPSFPFLCLTVSGGHTEIVRVNAPLDMIKLGKTIDDAAGEAFDKTGKMLGLEYPAGPIIDQLAQSGIPKFKFSKPKVKGLDFSFSGLKTSILYYLKKEIKSEPNFVKIHLNDICASVQKTIIEILAEKIILASKMTGIKEIGIAGGVSANSGLRAKMKELSKTKGWNVYIPHIFHCTDNAGMIAMTAHFKYLQGEFTDLEAVPEVRLSI